MTDEAQVAAFQSTLWEFHARGVWWLPGQRETAKLQHGCLDSESCRQLQTNVNNVLNNGR